jgi:hypothetical protein
MRRTRVIGLCLVAAFALSAGMVASASAAAPSFGRCQAKVGGKYENAGCTKEAKEVAKQKFEWTNTIAKNKFKAHMTGTLATLETVKGTKITCKAEKNSGAEYSGEKSVAKIVAEFSGCETGGIECANAGKGEIITKSLSGTLGVEKLGTTPPINNKLEVQLVAEAGGNLAEFKCSTISIEVKGCVAHPVLAGAMKLTTAEKFTASKGEQKPDKFLGGPTDECALESNSGTGFEEAGQTITAEVANEEKIEANPAA